MPTTDELYDMIVALQAEVDALEGTVAGQAATITSLEDTVATLEATADAEECCGVVLSEATAASETATMTAIRDYTGTDPMLRGRRNHLRAVMGLEPIIDPDVSSSS